MLNVNFEAMKKKILKILEEGKKYGYNNEAIANEILNLHNISNMLLCGMCDKETEHEQISSTVLKCLDCENIAVE